MRFLFLILAAALLVLGTARGQPSFADTILIVAISPEQFEDGKEATVEVTVAYDLTSFDEAVIELTANHLMAQGFSSIGNLRIKRGSGTTKVTGRFVSRYWTSNAPARLGASIIGSADPLVDRRILASDRIRIRLARRPHPPETDPTNPNPAVVYDDSIAITSVAPEILSEGEETEVTVTVAYELLSREQGEINLGINAGSGNSYTIIGSTLIKIGTGEAVVRARVVPQRTGKLPFAKIFVNLSEYPHRKSWSPLAEDSHPLEVR